MPDTKELEGYQCTSLAYTESSGGGDQWYRRSRTLLDFYVWAELS